MLGVGPVRWPYPGAVADNTRVPLNRIERILTFVIGSIAGLSIAAIIVGFIALAANVDVSQGVWPAVRLLPLIGLPLVVVLLIVFLVVSTLRRARLARDAGD
jgi:hypothetical protein